MGRKILIEIISFIFISLFFYTGLTKLADQQLFMSQVGKSFLLFPAAVAISWSVPIAEIIAGCLLMFPRTKMVGFFASYGLMALFTSYVATILLFAPELPCSCGGIIELLGWEEHLVLNISLMVLSVIAIALLNDGSEETTKLSRI